MSEQDNSLIDFIDDLIKREGEAAKKEGYKSIRIIYLDLIEAGFTMEEAMAYIAALFKANKQDEDDD